MGNRFSSIALGNKDTADRRPVPGPIGSTRPGPIRSTRSTKHRTSPYPHQLPKRAALECPASSLAHAITSHASSSSSSARVTRFRDVSPDTDSSNSDIEEGWDSHTTTHYSRYQGSDNAVHNERNQNATPPSCVSTPSAPMRNSGAPSYSGSHCYTTLHHMPTLSSPKVMSLSLDLRPIPACPTHSTSISTSVHVQFHAQTTSPPQPRTHVSRESSSDFESLNANAQGQAASDVEGERAVWEIEDEESPPGGHGGAMAAMNEDGGFPREILSTQVSARSIPQGSGSTSEGGHVPPRFSKQVNFSSPTISQGKIPKPPGEPGRPSSGGYNLQEATRLEPSRFRTVRKEMNSLVRTHLDTERTFTKQTEECVAAYTEEALRRFPFLNDYEDHWPIRGFAVMHLHYLQNRAKKMLRSAQSEWEGEIIEKC
ncbi:hypothetical protein GGF50DRAFT_125943 [Schizophyllum commune]